MMRWILLTLAILLAGCTATGQQFDSPLSEAMQSPLFVPAPGPTMYFPIAGGGPPPPMCPPTGWGVGMPRQDPMNKQRPSEVANWLRADWWHDWSYIQPAAGPDPRQALVWWGPAVSVDGRIDLARAAANVLPCRPVLMGNEPDGNNHPVAVWVDRMQSWKLEAPNAYWGCCGTIVNDAGFAWLNEYIAAGGPVPDIWHMHIYALWCPGEDNCRNDAERLERLTALLARWHADNGRGLPVVITEFGGSDSSSEQDAMAMDWGRDWLAGKVGPGLRPTGIAWFSSRYINAWKAYEWMYPNQWLLDEWAEATELGKQFRGAR